MTVKLFLLFICVSITNTSTYGQDVANKMIAGETPADDVILDKTNLGDELVKIQLFYECLCPDCRDFDSNVFKETVLEMGSYMDIHLYPYGNAKTIDNGSGSYTFHCQHGPPECYGNKLHACSIEALQNMTFAVLFNSCLMDFSHQHGSDDAAVDVCGTAMSVDPTPIKKCAKSSKGSELLKYYGDESKKIGFQYVPYVLINGELGRADEHFKEDVCKAFKKPPPQCKQ